MCVCNMYHDGDGNEATKIVAKLFGLQSAAGTLHLLHGPAIHRRMKISIDLDIEASEIPLATELLNTLRCKPRVSGAVQ